MIVYFSSGGVIFFSNCFFSIFSGSYNFWMINNIRIGLLNIQNLFDCLLLRLNIGFSNGGSSRNSNRDLSCNSLIIDNWSILNLFGVNWSGNFCSSNYRSLHDLLFDDRLRYNFFRDNGLRNNSSLNKRLRNDFLGLSDFGFSI